MLKLERLFSKMSKRMKSSIIRELLRDATNTSIISFGGGAPDPETFDRNTLARLSQGVLIDEYPISLQYGATEGDPLLKDELIKILDDRHGIKGLKHENLLITVGSQQALDLMGRIFLDEDSYVMVSHPIYLGAASAFRAYGPKFVTIDLEDDGLNVNEVERALKKIDSRGEISKLKFIYTVPNFHNPAGVTMSLEKRKALIELAHRYDVLILEDDPYGELRYEGEKLPDIYTLASGEGVVLLNTMSKVMSPGIRIGMIAGDKEIVAKAALAKQGADLCTPTFTQRLVARYLHEGVIFDRIKSAIEIYRKKKNVMLNALGKYIKVSGAKWTKPEGGLFIWVTLPKEYDTMKLFEKAKKVGVAYIPGTAFYVDDRISSNMRLSFCLPPLEQIEEGIKRIGKLFD